MEGSVISMLETPWFWPISCFTVCLPWGITGVSRLFCFCSFFSLRWARYLVMAAFSSRPVNFVPLTTSVKVLFSTSSCIFLASFPRILQGWRLILRRDHQPPQQVFQHGRLLSAQLVGAVIVQMALAHLGMAENLDVALFL